MSKTNTQIKKIISKIESVKKLTESTSNLNDLNFNTNGKNLSFDSLKNKNSKIKPESTSIFKNMLDIANSFLSDPKINIDNKDDKIIRYALDSSSTAIRGSKKIIKEELGTLFSGGFDDLCSSNLIVYSNSVYNLSPKEFDFMNVLKVNPTSLSGKIIYEDSEVDNGKVKFDTDLFNTFNTYTYEFNAIGGNKLFKANWNNTTQKFAVNTVENIQLHDFFDEYYESIDFPNSNHIIKNSMMLVLQGGDEPSEFISGINDLEKMVKKILSYCNLLSTDEKPLKNNPTDLVNEDDDDTQRFFDFNDNEGIDIDSETDRYNRVIKFRDCNNFEIPINNNHIEDFIYLNNLDVDSILNTLKKTSNDVSDDDNHIFFLSLLNTFITKIPSAMISAVLSPKMLFPIIFAYKVIKNIDFESEIKILMIKLRKLFYNIIRKLFKLFITRFWQLIKKDLLKFISKVAMTILLNKLKRYKTIVLSLIALLTKLLSTKINNCSELFGLIGLTIDGAFSVPAKIPLPGILLSLSDSLPGYSADRAYMGCIEKLQNSGVETGTLYGEPNKLLSVVKGIFDAHTEETDSNGYVSVSNKEIILPFGVIPPGILSSAGKNF